MQYSTFFLAAIASLASAAQNDPVIDGKILPAVQRWTMVNFKRTCNNDDTKCLYSFGIDPHDTGVQQCAYGINAEKEASRASYNSIQCGNFVISSTWSQQFGITTAFSTLGVVRDGQIIYPAYLDSELKNGTAVVPDKSFFPGALPKGK